MKFASWHVREFGTDRKKCMVKKLIKKENLDLIGLTEMKHQELTQRDISQCWGNHTVE